MVSLAARFICDPLSPDFRNFETTSTPDILAAFLDRRHTHDRLNSAGEEIHFSTFHSAPMPFQIIFLTTIGGKGVKKMLGNYGDNFLLDAFSHDAVFSSFLAF